MKGEYKLIAGVNDTNIFGEMVKKGLVIWWQRGSGGWKVWSEVEVEWEDKKLMNPQRGRWTPERWRYRIGLEVGELVRWCKKMVKKGSRKERKERLVREVEAGGKDWSSRCTEVADELQGKMGGVVWGFWLEDNPVVNLAGECEGHDFLVVDGFVVDPWIRVVLGETEHKGVYDLLDIREKGEVEKWYGEREKWKVVQD